MTAYTNPLHHTARFTKRPPGFHVYRGGGQPVDNDTYVETLHIGPQGYAVGPRGKAGRPGLNWDIKRPEPGAVVGWRLA